MNLSGIALLALLLLPQNPQPIKTVPNFESGETFHVEIRKAREDSSNPSTGFSITAADVVVREADPDGFMLEWVYGETRFQNEREPSNPSIKMDTDFRSLRLSIVLKRDGGFYLWNADDIFEGIRAATDAMIERALLSFPEGQRKQIGERVHLIVTPESQQAYVMRDVRLFLGSYGLELQPGTILERTVPGLNPVGSGTVDSLVHTELKSIDGSDAHIVIEHQYPPEVAAIIAREAKPPIVVPNPSDLSSAKVIDRTDLSYAEEAGFFREILHEFSITAGFFKRVDRIEMSVARQLK